MPTKIAWTDETWNPVHGCSKVSAGCDNCYAERISYHTYGHTELPWTPDNAAENVTERPDKLDYPSTFDEPKRIFVNSMSDLFHGEVSESFIREVFRVMRNHPEHIFQILTKRPGRAANMDLQWPPNVWLGTSVEDERVVERLDLLRDCDADVLFVSFEPLIGPVAEDAADLDLSGFDWAIVGGESGPNEDRREMAHEWVWPIRRTCMEQDVAFFFKQSSAAQPEQGQALRCPDGVRREFREMPKENEAVVKARNADRELVTDGGQPADEIDRSPWCAGCDHSMPDRDHAHKWIRMDGRKVGPFCTRNCAFCWVIRNDERALNYLDFEAIAEGPELVTDGGRVQDGDGIDRAWWPNGADEKLVRECNCGWCAELIGRLEHERAAETGDAPATDDGDLSLEAFAR